MLCSTACAQFHSSHLAFVGFFSLPSDLIFSLQVLISGYAYGGLSEVPEKDYYSCSMAQAICDEVGIYGHKPTVMMELMAGNVLVQVLFYVVVYSWNTTTGLWNTIPQPSFHWPMGCGTGITVT